MDDFRTIQPGKYTAKALKAELKTTKQGYRLVEVTFRLEDGEGTIAWTGWLGDDEDRNALTYEALRKCGWKGKDPADLSGVDTCRVQLVIADEEKNGVLRSRCKWVNRLYVPADHMTSNPTQGARLPRANSRPPIKVPMQSPMPSPFETDDDSPF